MVTVLSLFFRSGDADELYHNLTAQRKSIKDQSQCGTGSAATGAGICVPPAPSAAGLR